MNKPNTTIRAQPPSTKRRISAGIRKALTLRLEKAVTWAEAAEQSGMAQSSIYKAMTQDHVKEWYEEEKAKYCQRINEMEMAHKARALEVARELLDTSKSDTVRARMVEFFRGERAQNAVNVQINNSLPAPQGYEFIQPGAEVVTITSPDHDA